MDGHRTFADAGTLLAYTPGDEKALVLLHSQPSLEGDVGEATGTVTGVFTTDGARIVRYGHVLPAEWVEMVGDVVSALQLPTTTDDMAGGADPPTPPRREAAAAASVPAAPPTLAHGRAVPQPALSVDVNSTTPSTRQSRGGGASGSSGGAGSNRRRSSYGRRERTTSDAAFGSEAVSGSGIPIAELLRLSSMLSRDGTWCPVVAAGSAKVVWSWLRCGFFRLLKVVLGRAGVGGLCIDRVSTNPWWRGCVAGGTAP